MHPPMLKHGFEPRFNFDICHLLASSKIPKAMFTY